MTVVQLKHERDLLGQALGEVLVAIGVVSDVSLTGPELLAFAADAVEIAKSGAWAASSTQKGNQ